MLQIGHIIFELNRNRTVFENLLKDTPTALQDWTSEAFPWSLKVIVCHLLDEEVEDFRYRVAHTLQTPDKEIPGIDPVGWVEGRQYAQQNYEEKLQAFLTERDNSIAWLNTLSENSPWSNTYQHPTLGPLSAKLFFCNWLSHDYHHIRQINNLKRAYLAFISQEDLSYAGDW